MGVLGLTTGSPHHTDGPTSGSGIRSPKSPGAGGMEAIPTN